MRDLELDPVDPHSERPARKGAAVAAGADLAGIGWQGKSLLIVTPRR